MPSAVTMCSSSPNDHFLSARGRGPKVNSGKFNRFKFDQEVAACIRTFRLGRSIERITKQEPLSAQGTAVPAKRLQFRLVRVCLTQIRRALTYIVGVG